MSVFSEDHKEIESGKRKDEEGHMAHIELDSIEKSVNRLRKVIKKSDQQLPAWVQSKITRATDFIDTAAEYLSSDEKLSEGASFKINPERHRKSRPPVGAEKLRKMSPKQRAQLPNQELIKSKVGVELPKLRESSLTDRILAEMGCDCDMKPHKSVNEIAKKHNTSVERIEKQLKKGIKVEMEHTTDKSEAESIALQHLAERPDYYVKLSKVENAPIQEETKSGDSSLRDWFSKSSGRDPKTGRKVPGWVQIGGPYAGAPCARQPDQKSTPKCGSSKMAGNLSDKEEEKAFKRKNRKDPNQPEKSGASRPTYVKTEEYLVKEDKKEKSKKDACYHKVKSRYDVWPSAYGSASLVKCRKFGASNWGTKSEEVIQEGVRIQSQSGQLMNIMLNWRNKIIVTQMFFPQVRIPKKLEVLSAVEKVYPGAKVLTFRVSVIDPKMPLVQVKEGTEAWQKVNRKDRVDGLSQKAVNTYRREHPGSKLQTAVTEKNPTGKRKKRRKSYCSRSEGQMKMHNISCSEDPKKPICKARRRWNCE